jgi:N-acetyl-anhydromuramyl-L-alanine amidase AmpD
MTQDEREKLYTIRWYVREKWGAKGMKDDVLELLGDILEPNNKMESRPSISETNQKLLYCPFANHDFPKAKTRGTYAKGYPRGAVVHYTAGRRSGLKREIQSQINNGYLYFVIDKDGNIAQNFPLDSWGYHAGKSKYNGLVGSVSNELVGIEIQCAGMVKKDGAAYKTWFNTTVKKQNVREIASKKDNQTKGYYQKYTKAQEKALTNLILWLYSNNPNVFSLDLVVGHDEVSPNRKQDPGGALSKSMPEYREYLKSLSKTLT